jgi:hypothetical protein
MLLEFEWMLARTNRGDPAELADLKSACGGSSHCVLDYWCTSCLLCICMACSWRQRAREHEEGVTGSDKQVSRRRKDHVARCPSALCFVQMRCFWSNSPVQWTLYRYRLVDNKLVRLRSIFFFKKTTNTIPAMC